MSDTSKTTIHRPPAENEKFKINRTKPVAPASRTVTHERPSTSPGVGNKTYTVNTPVKGSGERKVHNTSRHPDEGRKD